MKINKFITIATVPILLGGLLTPFPSYAKKVDRAYTISQANTQQSADTLIASGKEILTLFFDQKFEQVSSSLSSQLQQEISVDRLEELWKNTESKNGKFQGIENSTVKFTIGSDLAIFTLKFEKVTEDWILIFNDQGDLIGVDIPTSLTIEQIADNFITSLAKGDYTTARMRLHPFLKERIFGEQLQNSWQKFTQTRGDFKAITKTTVRNASNSDDTDVVILDVEFTQAKEQIFIIFDSSKSIIGVDFIQ